MGLVLYEFIIYLKGTVQTEHVNVNKPELAKGCFPFAVPTDTK